MEVTNTQNELNRYLEFSLGKETYAIPLLQVREVISVPETTSVPRSPDYFTGIMNLRGNVISVIDLRRKLGIDKAETTEEAVIILDFDDFNVGVVVDSINKVLNIESEDLGQVATIKANLKSEYIQGVYKKHEVLTIIIDIAKALGVEDLLMIKEQQSLNAA